MARPLGRRRAVPAAPRAALARLCLVALVAASAAACSPRPAVPGGASAGGSAGSGPAAPAPRDPRLLRVDAALAAAGLPEEARLAADARIAAAEPRFLELLALLEAERALDPERFVVVDKVAAPLGPDYEPGDLSALDGTGLSLSRSGHRLRAGAREALLAMAGAARSEGIDLLVSSTYRSFAYQKEVFARAVARDGEAEARRVSAEPGRSQHQLGTAVDFGAIDDSFAGTAPALWLEARARDFGYSLSYPKDAEALTGYRWESWHYRWLGRAFTALESEYFGGMQKDALAFLAAF